jgi:hypothetical protein
MDATTDDVRARRGDDAMLKAAAGLTRDLNQPNAAIYWSDMLGSAVWAMRARRDHPRTLDAGWRRHGDRRDPCPLSRRQLHP